jgi:protein phosphatase
VTIITIPEPALVILIGPTGSGKSTFAAKHFRPTEVVSSDWCRALVSDDENNQDVTPGAFRILHAIVRERLRAHRMTVVDATNVERKARKPILDVARRFGYEVVAVVFDFPFSIFEERNAGHRSIPDGGLHFQFGAMKRAIPLLRAEGVQHIHVLASPQEVDEAQVERQPKRGGGTPRWMLNISE